MFLHIGGEVLAPIPEIQFILDWKTMESDITKSFVTRRKTVDICAASANPRSLIITDGEIFISPISPITLKRRLAQVTAIFSGELEEGVKDV